MKLKNLKEKWGLPEDCSIRIREIRCNKKGCTKCPHGFYLYARIKEQGKKKDKYIGKCTKTGEPR